MPLPVAPIVVAGATAAIGYFFQENSAKNARLHHRLDVEREDALRLHNRELTTAQEIHHEISSSLEVLSFYIAHGAMSVAVRKARGDGSREAQDAETWSSYQKALLTWMSQKNRFSALIQRYFGNSTARQIDEINDSLAAASSLLNATYYDGRGSLVGKDGKVRSSKFYALVKPLEQKLIRLNHNMIADIQNECVGRLRGNKTPP